MPVTVTHEAADKKAGMTFREVTDFVEDAMRHDAAGGSKVEVVTGFRAQIQRLTVTAP